MKVTHHDNRGTAEEPYGFLYFDDGRTRMAYGLGKIHPSASGGWAVLTPEHKKPAIEYAREHGLAKDVCYG